MKFFTIGMTVAREQTDTVEDMSALTGISNAKGLRSLKGLKV